MYRRGNKRKIVASLILVLVLSLSIGFAAYTNTLRITPQATITPDSATFDIDFSSTNTGVVASDITPTLTGTGITAEAAEIDNSTNPTISNLSVNFTKPGQKAEYKFYAYNNGAYLAYLNSINFLNAEGADAFKTCEAVENTTQYVEAACNGIKVTIKVGSLTTDKTETNITGHNLATQTAEEIILTIEYEENSAVADGAFNVTFGDITLVYTSVDEIATPEPNEPTTDGYVGAHPCTYDGELTQGAEYVNGQYTYRYMQASTGGDTWRNIEEEGWGVVLNDKGSDTPAQVNTIICSSINNKPIVSMAEMYSGAYAIVDASSIDTSNVTDMSFMFAGQNSNTPLVVTGLSNFDTSNVTYMSGMFAESKGGLSLPDIANFDTSNVTDMEYMFDDSDILVNVSSFDTSSVRHMKGMFARSIVPDLSNFNTSNVTDMMGMFTQSVLTNGNLTNFDVSKVTDMYYMFANASVDTLDLSSFDTSKNPDIEGMFYGAVVTTAYARNAEEAAKFNNAEITSISGFTFTVK